MVLHAESRLCFRSLHVPEHSPEAVWHGVAFFWRQLRVAGSSQLASVTETRTVRETRVSAINCNDGKKHKWAGASLFAKQLPLLALAVTGTQVRQVSRSRQACWHARCQERFCQGSPSSLSDTGSPAPMPWSPLRVRPEAAWTRSGRIAGWVTVPKSEASVGCGVLGALGRGGAQGRCVSISTVGLDPANKGQRERWGQSI